MSDQMCEVARFDSRDDRSLEEVAIRFNGLRPRLLRIARRIVGDHGEAEDVVQDVWLRWQTCDQSSVMNVTAFLVTTTTRAAINASQTARVRRESPVEPSGPDFIRGAVGPSTEAGFERSENLALAVRVLMERLAPLERAAYVLREAFGYSYQEIAALFDVTPANARKIVSRASMRLTAGRRNEVDYVEHRRLVIAFTAATRTGELEGLEMTLSLAAGAKPQLAQAS